MDAGGAPNRTGQSGAADTLAAIAAEQARPLRPAVDSADARGGQSGYHGGMEAGGHDGAGRPPGSQYGGLALVFAGLAQRLAEWKHALEGWNMGESQVANEWRGRWNQGLREGRLEGQAARSWRSFKHASKRSSRRI